MILYETVMQTPTISAYDKHVFVERIFKEHGVEQVRNYTWGLGPGRGIIARYPAPIHENVFCWTSLEPPSAGTKIRFQLDVAVRFGKQRTAEWDYLRNLLWLERRSDGLGLQLVSESVDAQPVTVPIIPTHRTDRARQISDRPFILTASRFDGVATIKSHELFAHALATSIGNAKAFGLGFLKYTVFGAKR